MIVAIDRTPFFIPFPARRLCPPLWKLHVSSSSSEFLSWTYYNITSFDFSNRISSAAVGLYYIPPHFVISASWFLSHTFYTISNFVFILYLYKTIFLFSSCRYFEALYNHLLVISSTKTLALMYHTRHIHFITPLLYIALVSIEPFALLLVNLLLKKTHKKDVVLTFTYFTLMHTWSMFATCVLRFEDSCVLSILNKLLSWCTQSLMGVSWIDAKSWRLSWSTPASLSPIYHG